MDSDYDSSDYDSDSHESMKIDYKNDRNVYDRIIYKNLNLDAFAKLSISSSGVASELQNIKNNFSKIKKSSNMKNEDIVIELTQKDLDLRKNKNNEVNDLNNTDEFEDNYERFYGTSIDVKFPEKQEAYLNFDCPAWEMESKLNKLLTENQKSQLNAKSSLAEDIEKHFQLQPYRQSTRQRKKQNLEKNSNKLPGWFDMKRVTEITKEQQKDLDALEMRRVWNPKVFYKKNSAPTQVKNSKNKAGFFQIGTIEQTSADFYNDRVTRKNRKRNIVDELLADHDVKAYNKRKLKYAMSKNSRLSSLHRRAKLKRAKQKIRNRKFFKKGVDPNEGRKIVQTY